MNSLSKAFYQLTAYFPRKLPKTPQEFASLRQLMIDAYGCNDQPSTTMVMAGQVTSTEAHKLRKSYGHIANCVKRLEINAVAAEFRGLAIKENNERLEAATRKCAEAFEAEEKEKNDQNAEEQPKEDGQPEPEGPVEPISPEPAQVSVPSPL